MHHFGTNAISLEKTLNITVLDIWVDVCELETILEMNE